MCILQPTGRSLSLGGKGGDAHRIFAKENRAVNPRGKNARYIDSNNNLMVDKERPVGRSE